MPDHLKSILEGKKLLLTKELLHKTGFKDHGIMDEVSKGFDVVGKCQPSSILERKLKPATTSVAQLKQSAPFVRKSILNMNRASIDLSIDEEVWSATLKEKEDGWLLGPYTSAELDEKFPDGWLTVPRFGILQGAGESAKIRSIDDCKLPGINTALSSVEKLLLQDTDSVCAAIAYISQIIRASIIRGDREFIITLSTGKEIQGTVSKEWGDMSTIALQGRTLDLSAAYKNLGNSADTLWSCVIAAWNPGRSEYNMFISAALMFGATSSVYSFNRVAKAIQHLASTILWILNCQFFDDFPTIELGSRGEDSRSAFEELLLILGWKCASGPKEASILDHFHSVGKYL